MVDVGKQKSADRERAGKHRVESLATPSRHNWASQPVLIFFIVLINFVLFSTFDFWPSETPLYQSGQAAGMQKDHRILIDS